MLNTEKSYYSLSRPEVFNLLGEHYTDKKILEFGCGFGELGKVIKKTWHCSVTGIEINPDAAVYLKDIYDQYRITDLEQFDINLLEESYDCFIYADVLEHLKQPDLILKAHLDKLKKGGIVIISLPNIRNLKIIADLLIKGVWNYQSSGILDKTHYKFFTRKTLVQLVEDAGLTVELITCNKDKFKGLKKLAAFIPYLLIPELKVCQWLIKAKKN